MRTFFLLTVCLCIDFSIAHDEHPELQTFYISQSHLPTLQSRIDTGKAMIDALQRDSIFNIAIDGIIDPLIIHNAFAEQSNFFNLPLSTKMQLSNNLSYSGYVYSGEETTADKQDAAEIFTITPDIPTTDPRVINHIPCHGPVPWPSNIFQQSLSIYGSAMRNIGNTILPLIALGLGMEENAFDGLTSDSWGHMRVLKFRSKYSTNMTGIGSHTDYGLLVLASQDEVGGLWVRPYKNETVRNNWQESTAGMFANNDGWKFVAPKKHVITCFAGDMMQFITGGRVMSTLHKVELAQRVRYAIAYFHEPSFGAVIGKKDTGERVHYGEHFTNMFERCYPEKSVTQKIQREGLKQNLWKSVTGVYMF